jgi:catechol 2,3-dioxygenase-like lactoylglutathione lyase family enzyme
MGFHGSGHVCPVVSDFDACAAFDDQMVRHLGMKPCFSAPPFFRGWFADEYMFVIARSAQAGDHFSQFRVGLHHWSFRATSRAEVDSFATRLDEIGAKIVHPPELGPVWPGYYSVLCEDPDGARIAMNYHSARRMEHGCGGERTAQFEMIGKCTG